MNYTLTRQVPSDPEVDVIVAGGGPAGSAAAICAARLGAKVLLVEATGCLGGMGTSGLVNAFDPMADGEKSVVGGVMREIVETMYERGFLGPQVTPDFWRERYYCWTPFRAEGLKLILDEFTQQAGVEVRFFTRLIDVDADAEGRTVRGVILHNVEGYRYVPAKAFIDATGDAVLASLSGVECREAGRDTERIMPATLASLFSGIDWGRVKYKEQQDGLEQALKDGHFSQVDRLLPGMAQAGNTLGYLNGGHVFGLDALRCKDLSEGIMLGRRIVCEYESFYRKYVPGCEALELVTTASLMGIRESRRIVGEYELTIDDYMARRQFPDQIGCFSKCVDIHPYDTSEKEWERFCQHVENTKLGRGESFGLPYGIIVPRDWRNLWVAGRCNSSDVEVHGAIRVMPAAAMMGQAAGTAAVQSIKTGQPACELDTVALVDTLKANGAYLP